MSTQRRAAASRSKPEREFRRTISSLNEDYGLRIVNSPHHTSTVASGHAETRDIYERLYDLHSPGHEKALSKLLEQFDLKAQEVSRQWVSKPRADPDHLPEISRPAPLGARSDTERAALLKCLHQLLVTMPATPTKRHSGDNEGPASKIRVTRSGLDDIDAIPVQSNSAPPPSDFHESTLPPSQTPLARRTNNTSSMNGSANTSRISLMSSVFSGSGTQETTASSQSARYTWAKSITEPLSRLLGGDGIFGNGSHEGGERNELSSNREQKSVSPSEVPVAQHQVPGPPLRGSTAATNPIIIESDDELEGEDFSVREDDHANELHCSQSTAGESAGHITYALWDTLSPEPSRYSDRDDAAIGVTESLRKMWPNPAPGLIHAPLAVIWEVTRAAIHCKVDLRFFDLVYEDTNEWRNLDMLRQKISRHVLFVNQKGLPERCDDATWDAALNGFRAHDKVVVLSAELSSCPVEGESPFRLHLKPMKLELGHRLDRRFGADRFLEITMPSPESLEQKIQGSSRCPISSEQFFQWLCLEVHHFVGRCWIPFFSKPVTKKVTASVNGEKKVMFQYLDQVYFYASDGDHFRNPLCGGQYPPPEEAETLDRRTKLSYDKLLEWTINPTRSGKQPALKLFSRVSLNLTRVYASVVLEPVQIRHMATDIMSVPDQNGKRMEMNDGMGRMSWGLCNKIAEELELGYIPSAFQGRLGSAKGMWIRDVDSPEVEGDIWIETYPSQRKWECDFVDIHHRSFEVRSYSKELKPASLNQQFIPILEARAVADHKKKAMRAHLGRHLSKSLESDLKMHLNAMNHPAETLLFVKQMRRAGFTSATFDGLTRFLGGLPNKSEDIVAFLLDSGFSVCNSKLLADTMWKMWEEMTERVKDKWSFEVPCSTNAYMAVDFSGVLKPGEVHLSFSSAFNVEGFSDTQLEDMDILVARSPAHFPSDIQKVRVVSRPKLRKLKDVIIFPSTGSRPLADLLSGGDYDGDRAWICWDRDIVDNFSNADPSPDCDFVAEGFLRKQSKTFNQILDSCFGDISLACEDFHLLGMKFNMRPSLLGRCTKYKEKLSYHTSVDHKSVLALSVLLSNLVDQAKAGIEFNENDWKRFRNERLKQGSYEDPEYTKESSASWLKRSPPHILDYLKFEVANPCVEKMSTELHGALRKARTQRADFDLTKKYRDYNCRARNSDTFKSLMAHLHTEIVKLREEWAQGGASFDGYEARVQIIHAKWVKISPPEHLKEATKVRDLRDDWATGGRWEAPFSQWSNLKASTTFYKLHHNDSSYKLAWLLAGKQLAVMKSTIHGNSLGQANTSAVFMQPALWTVRKPDKRLIERMWKRRTIVGSEKTAALDDVTELDDDGTVIDD